MAEQKTLKDMNVDERKDYFAFMDKQKEGMYKVQKEEISNAYQLMGANELLTNYGNAGKNIGTYSLARSLGNPSAQGKKLGLLEKKLQKNQQLGISVMPTVTDDELNTHIMELAYQGFEMLGLEQLESIVKEKDPKADYSSLEISKKANEIETKMQEHAIQKGESYKLSDEENATLQDAKNYRIQLIDDFKQSAVMNQLAENSQQNRNQFIELMKDRYGKPEKKPEKKE